MSNNQLPADKELILEKHCPSMSLLYLDSNGRAFRERILKAMEDYAGATEYATKLLEAQQEIERLKAIANLWRPLMEEAIRQDSLYGHVPIETINKIKRFLYGE